MEIYQNLKSRVLPNLLRSIVLGCCLISITATGQYNGDNAPDSLHALHAFEKITEYKESADKIFSAKDTTAYSRGYALLDSAVVEAKRAAKFYAKLQNWEKWYDSQSEASSIYLANGKFELLVDHLYADYDLIKRVKDQSFYLSKINSWLGYTLYYLGDYKKALKHYLEEVNLLAALNNPKGQYGNFENIAALYSMQRDYDEAISYLKRAEQLNLDNPRVLFNIYWNFGKAYLGKGDYQEALTAMDRCKEIIGEDYEVDLNIGMIYEEMGDVENAKVYLNKVQKGIDHSDISPDGIYYALKARILTREKQFDAAIAAYNNALTNQNQLENLRELAKLHIELAILYTEIGTLDSALVQSQTALQLLIFSFKEDAVDRNPELEVFDLANGVWIMEALISKGDAFWKRYEQNQKLEDAEKAIECYDAAFKTIDVLRYHQISETAKTDLIGYAHPIYEKALRSIFHLYQQTGEEQYFDRAFKCSQKTKAFLLSSSLQNINAQEQGGVPDSLIKKERLVKDLILKTSQELLRAGESRKELETQLFDAKMDLHFLKDHLEKNYPNYFELKYQDRLVGLKDVQQQIPDDHTVLIDYFVGEHELFILTIFKNKVHTQVLTNPDELQSNIQVFNQQVSTTRFVSEEQYAYDQYTTTAYQLYLQLVAPSIAASDQKVKRLLLIPDGILTQLSFGALLSSKPKGGRISYSAKQLDYLLEDFSIQYFYTPKTLFEKTDSAQERGIKSFAGFAPVFSSTDFYEEQRSCVGAILGDLKYNTAEVESIHKILGGDPFLGDTATIENFKNYAPDYQILHLATHACMSETDSKEHRIYFSDAAYLSGYELFNMRLHADMVVLSACETGVGEIVRGEGVMSLARGFAYTGCPSIITSMWEISDKTSKDLMLGFYQELDRGLAKDQALQQAQLNYLNTQKERWHHPYYWAAFISIGDTSPINLDEKKSWYWWGSGAVLLLLLGLFFLKKK